MFFFYIKTIMADIYGSRKFRPPDIQRRRSMDFELCKIYPTRISQEFRLKVQNAHPLSLYLFSSDRDRQSPQSTIIIGRSLSYIQTSSSLTPPSRSHASLTLNTYPSVGRIFSLFYLVSFDIVIAKRSQPLAPDK